MEMEKLFIVLVNAFGEDKETDQLKDIRSNLTEFYFDSIKGKLK